MEWTRIQSALDELRRRIGEERFQRFILAVRDAGGDRLFHWQLELIEELERETGHILPRYAAELGRHTRSLIPPPGTLPASRVPDWIKITSLEGIAPVQGEGSADGAAWYFRARHDAWSIGVSRDPEVDPVDVCSTTETTFYHEEPYGHQDEAASYMPEDEARFFIVRELTRWRGGDVGERAGDAGA